MRYSSQIKTICDLKTNATAFLVHVVEQQEQLVITQNSEAKDVQQEFALHEETQYLIKCICL